MEDVDAYIRAVQLESYNGPAEILTEGVVQKDDLVNLWYRGEVNIGTADEPEWVEFLGGSNFNNTAPYSLRIGSGQFIDGFEEALIGLSIEDTGIHWLSGTNKQVGQHGEIVVIEYGSHHSGSRSRDLS